MTKAQLPLFERNNPGLLINLLIWQGEKDDKNPIHVIRPAPKPRKEADDYKIVSILAVEIEKEKWHYVGVTKLDRLLNTSGNPRTYCERCLKPLFWGHKGQSKESVKQEHLKSCFMINPDSIKMTEEKTLSFTSYGKTQRLPYVLYADIECFLQPDSQDESLTHHVPCSIGLLLVPHPNMKAKPLTIPYTTFTGPTCLHEACDFIESIAKQVYEWNKTYSYQKVVMSADEKREFKSASKCYICEKSFDEERIKVCEHDHLTGVFE